MPTTDDDLLKMQKDTEKLRQQVVDEERKQRANEAQLTNDISATALKTEQNRLTAQLAALKATSSVSAVKKGAVAVLDPLSTAEAQEAAVVAQTEAEEKKAE